MLGLALARLVSRHDINGRAYEKIAVGILLCFMGMAGQANGAAIEYTINFNSSTGLQLPTGSFKYDATKSGVGETPFSDFFVMWRGIQFDFTNDANGDDLHNSCPTGPGTNSGVTNFTALFSGTDPCGPHRWLAEKNDTFANFTFRSDVSGEDPTFREVDIRISADRSGDFRNGGSYTVTQVSGEVPEPATALMTISAAALSLSLRVRPKKTNHTHANGN